MVIKRSLIISFSILILMACNDKREVIEPSTDNPTIVSQLIENYEQLPEQEIITSLDQHVYAQYAEPTERYGHGVLGDRIEAGQLVVVVDSVFYELTLTSDYVFEDISPRMYDVDGDNELEFITIRTHVTQGAGIAIDCYLEWGYLYINLIRRILKKRSDENT